MRYLLVVPLLFLVAVAAMGAATLVNDNQLASPYSGVGTCPPYTIGFTLARNTAPSCVPSPTPTPAPTQTETPTFTPGPTETPTPTPTPTVSPTPTPSPAPTPQHAGVGSVTDSSGDVISWNVDASPSIMTPTPSVTPTPNPLTAIGGSVVAVAAFGTSVYMPVNGVSNANTVAASANIAGPVSSIYTLKNMQCQCAAGPGGGTPGNTRTFFLQDNNGDTALTCSFQGATHACSDTSHTALTVVGHLYNYRIVSSPGATPTATPVAAVCSCSVGP